MERLVEERKEDYYRVLGECSHDWHKGRNEILPWWNYVLGVVRSAYKELETQVMLAPIRPAKGDMVRRTVLEQVGDFTLADLVAQLPNASPQLIKKVLGELKRQGHVHLAGRGRGAIWNLTPKG